MLYLVSIFWVWLLLALVLGLVVGWLTFSREGKANWAGLLPWGLLLGAGAIVAALKLAPDGIGYWVDLAVLALAAYLTGCLVSALLRAAQSKPEVSAVEAPARVMPTMAPAGELAVEPAKAAMPIAQEASEEAITGLSGPRDGKGDDLTRIYGIDAETQKKLNALGLFHFDQIAALTPGNRRWLFRHLGYDGRFPSWWWRWRYDAEQIIAGKAPSTASATFGEIMPAPAKKPAAKKPTAKPVEVAKAEPAVAAPVIAEPAAATPVALAAMPADAGTKPAGIEAPRGGKADDLKRIKGIGKQNEGRLHGLGIWHFDQIGKWTAEEVTWVGTFLAFPGRIEREGWVEQARLLAAGGETEFSKRADAGLVESSLDTTNDDGQGNVIAVTPVKPAPKPKPKS
jgi:predicted flap endonuclease-1-like 5' DNA nuclease